MNLIIIIIITIIICTFRTLEEELMPLIQSEVNAEMRDLQMDSQLFMAPSVNSSSVPKSGDDVNIFCNH